MEPRDLLEVLGVAAGAVAGALAGSDDWELAGTRPGQHRSDLVADDAAVAVLTGAGLAVLSEESGRSGAGDTVVVLDPLDGSTNAARRLPWYATSLCAVDGDGPVAALVVDLVAGTRFEAVRGGGARRDGEAIAPSTTRSASTAVIGVSGPPPATLGYRQFRALGAVALDLCAVADGRLDGYVDCSVDAHGPWDYLGGMLVCREAGALVADAQGRELVVLDHAGRRTPVAAATPELLADLLEPGSTGARP